MLSERDDECYTSPGRASSRYNNDIEARVQRGREATQRRAVYDVQPSYAERDLPYSPINDVLSKYTREMPRPSVLWAPQTEWRPTEDQEEELENRDTQSRYYGSKLLVQSAGLVKRVDVPTFNGDDREYHAWREGFDRIVDRLNILPEFKMIHLRKCLTGEARAALSDLGCSDIAYTVALQILERRFGGERRRTAHQRADIDSFKSVRPGNAKDLEQFAALLDVVVVNLLEKKQFGELGNGYLFQTLQTKLNEDLLNAYKRWMREHRNPATVESLRLFVMEEAEDQVATMETFHGVSARKADRPDRNPRNRASSHATVGVAPGQQGDRSLDCKQCGA